MATVRDMVRLETKVKAPKIIRGMHIGIESLKGTGDHAVEYAVGRVSRVLGKVVTSFDPRDEGGIDAFQSANPELRQFHATLLKDDWTPGPVTRVYFYSQNHKRVQKMPVVEDIRG